MNKKEYVKTIYEKLLEYVNMFENEKYGQGKAQNCGMSFGTVTLRSGMKKKVLVR